MGHAGEVGLQQRNVRGELLVRFSGVVAQTAICWLGAIVAAVWFWAAFLKPGAVHPARLLLAAVVVAEVLCGLACFALAKAIGRHQSPQAALRRSAWCFNALVGFLFFYPEYFLGHTPPLLRSLALTACIALLFAGLLAFELRYRARAGAGCASDTSARTAVAVVASGYFLVTTAIALWKLHVLAYVGLDLSYFSQCFYTTLHGQFFHGNVIQDRLYAQPVQSDFAAHNSPIMLALLPFYWLHPSPATLLVIRNLFMALCAWPAYQLARQRYSPNIAAVIAIAYLFLPTVLYQSVFDFALLSVAAPFLLWTFHYYFCRDLRRYLFFAFAALCIREDIVFVVAGLAFIALIQRRSKAWVMASVGMAGAWALVSWKLVIPYFLHGVPPMVQSCFAHLGSSAPDIIHKTLSSPRAVLLNWNNLVYLKQVLTPFGGFMVGGSSMLLLATPYLGINLLSSSGMCFTTGLIFFHYSLVPVVVLFAAWLLTLYRASTWSERRGMDRTRVQVAGALFLLTLSLASVVFIAERNDFDKLRPQSWQQEAKLLAQTIPPQAAVAAPRYLLPTLANRTILYELHRVPDYHNARPDYIIMDLDWGRVNAPEKYHTRYLSMLSSLHSRQFPIVYSSTNYVVFSVPVGEQLSQVLTEAKAICNE